jgi:hypothetical protein
MYAFKRTIWSLEAVFCFNLFQDKLFSTISEKNVVVQNNPSSAIICTFGITGLPSSAIICTFGEEKLYIYTFLGKNSLPSLGLGINIQNWISLRVDHTDKYSIGFSRWERK